MKAFAPWPDLRRIAQDETARLLHELPREIRRQLDEVPIVFDRIPGDDLVGDGLDRDLLGLFVGDDLAHSGSDPIPREIILFLENILDEAGNDHDRFREEVRKTLLHEIGHYLGLDEQDLFERNLE